MKRWVLLGSLLLAACAQAANPTPESSPNPTQTATATTAAETPAANETKTTPTGVFERPVYSLNAALDYNAHYLSVTEQIVYTNNSTDDLEEIPLLIEANHLGALFSLTALDCDRGTESKQETDRIELTLTQPLQPGEQLTINVQYSLSLPQKPGILAWTERQANFIDWYPFIPPYVNGKWLINLLALQGEHLAYESADFDVRISLVNAPALMQIAAPAPATETNSGSYQYRLESARRFSWSAGNNYKMESTQTASGIPVTVYFFEEERDAAKASMHAAAKAIDIYSGLFGDYPYQSLSIVECTFPDGMESDGLFFLDMSYFRLYNYKTTNLLITLSAHETAHNWWYGSVGNDPANEPWLDEALATYSELLFYEKAYSNDLDWWWEFRVNKWNPTGWVDSTIYELTSFRPYVNAVYLRGALFLEEVRNTLGNEIFFALLKDYAQKGAGRIVSGEEFFWRLAYAGENHIGELDTILNKYFRLKDR